MPFDPRQPFELVPAATGFDPNQPFELVGSAAAADQKREQLAVERRALEADLAKARLRLAATTVTHDLVESTAAIPATLVNLPARLVNTVAGRQLIREVQPGEPLLPEMLKDLPELTEDVRQMTESSLGQQVFRPGAAAHIAGGMKGVEDLARGLTSPEVTLAGPAGMARGALARAVPTLFAGQMIKDTPQAYQEFGRLTVEGKPGEAARAGVGALGSSAFITHMAGKSVLRSGLGQTLSERMRNREAREVELELVDPEAPTQGPRQLNAGRIPPQRQLPAPETDGPVRITGPQVLPPERQLRQRTFAMPDAPRPPQTLTEIEAFLRDLQPDKPLVQAKLLRVEKAPLAQTPPATPEAPATHAAQAIAKSPSDPSGTTLAQRLANLPSVQPGMVRLFHGGGSSVAGMDFTPSASYADGYRSMKNGNGGSVWWIDVPQDAPFLKWDLGVKFDAAGNSIPVLINGQKLPESVSAKARKIESVGQGNLRANTQDSAQAEQPTPPQAPATPVAPATAKGGTSKGNTVEQWADATINEGRKRSYTGLDPELMAAYAVKGAFMIGRGARDFAQWSAAMLKEYGTAIKPHLEALFKQSQSILDGTHPDKGLSARALKFMADERFEQGARDVDPGYSKFSFAGNREAAEAFVQAAGGPVAAAEAVLRGDFGAPGHLGPFLNETIQTGLARQERALRSAGSVAEADAIITTQRQLARLDIDAATNAAQVLNAMREHYTHWSPAAWLREFQELVGNVSRQRVRQATQRKEVGASATEQAQAIAETIADQVAPENPKVARVIREQFGQRGGREQTPGGMAERLEQSGRARKGRGKAAADKINEFYAKEVRKFRRKYNIPEFDPAAERELLQQANQVDALPRNSIQRTVAAQRLFDWMMRRKGFDWWELPMDFWYANILSGLSTHAKNVLGNGTNLAFETLLMMGRNPTAIPMILEAYGRALPAAARDAAAILKTGRDTTSRHGGKFSAPGAMERIVNPVGSKLLLPWKLVSRLLKAEDVAFYYPLQEGRAAVLARDQLKREQVPFMARNKAARELLGWTAETRAKALAQAKAEGLTGNTLSRRVNELIEQQRPPLLMENARDYAFFGTFNNDLYGVLGVLGNHMIAASNAVPPLRLVVPFVRVVANLTNSMMNWTPVGYWRAARAQGHKLLVGKAEHTGKLMGQEVTDPLAVGDMYARATVGTATLMALAFAAGQYALEDDPPFMITGRGPSDKDQNRTWRAAGNIPYALKIGSRHYSYQDKPLALPLAIIGHYLDAVRYLDLSEQDAINRVLYAFNSSMNVLLDSSWLQGLSSMFNQANRDATGKAHKGLASQGAKTLSSFVVPNALRQLDALFDPTKYSSDDIRGMMLNQVPFARRLGRPDLNVFGEPVAAPTSKLFWSQSGEDPLVNLLASRRLWPSVPQLGDMTPQEHYDLMQVRGPLLRQKLTENMATLAAPIPREEAEATVRRISAEVTAEAKSLLDLQTRERLRRKGVL